MTTKHRSAMAVALRLRGGAHHPPPSVVPPFARLTMVGHGSSGLSSEIMAEEATSSCSVPSSLASSEEAVRRSFGTSGGGSPSPPLQRRGRVGSSWTSASLQVSRNRQRRFLSSSSTSPGGVKVEVTRTTRDNDHDDEEVEDDDEDEQQAASGGGVGCCGGSSAGVKSPERMAEERLMDLQHHIRQTHSEGRYDDALKASEALIEGCEMLYGKDHPATASAYNNAAVMHKLLGEYGAAAERYHDALRVYGEVVGKDHASYAAALNNLGNLLRTQVQLDPELSSFQRLQLNESAIEYLEEALSIRSVELGDDHPHTVTSRSNLGGALASHVLSSPSDGDAGPSKLTRERWEAAEDHLRSALRISIENQDKIPDLDDGTGEAGGEATSSGGAVVRTLPAASAAQNLAVFLKSRADRVGVGGGPNSTGDSDVHREDMYAEARKLYNEALSVRVGSLGDAHPDTVATRHSLAELLLSTGDEVGSDRLRRKILESLEEEGYDGEDGGKDSAAK